MRKFASDQSYDVLCVKSEETGEIYVPMPDASVTLPQRLSALPSGYPSDMEEGTPTFSPCTCLPYCVTDIDGPLPHALILIAFVVRHA